MPHGINIELIKNHPYLNKLKTEINSTCKNCPGYAVNPCCIEQKFFVYPRQFEGNCNVFLSTTAYALEFLAKRGELMK